MNASLTLRIMIGIQLVLGVLWMGPLLISAGASFSTLAVFIYTYPIHALFFLVAAWMFWRYPAERKKAALVMALPFVFLVAPSVIKTLFGGPLYGANGVRALIIIAAGLLAVAVLFPKKTYGFLPQGLMQNRAFNWLIIVGNILAWLFPWVALVMVAQSGSSGGSGGGQGSPGMGVAVLFVMGAIYTVAVGAGGALTAVIGWLGVRSGPENPVRKLNVAQMVMGLPAIVLGSVSLAWLASQSG